MARLNQKMFDCAVLRRQNSFGALNLSEGVRMYARVGVQKAEGLSPIQLTSETRRTTLKFVKDLPSALLSIGLDVARDLARGESIWLTT